MVGQQQGIAEAWVLPVKLLSHLTIEAAVEGYDLPLDLNTMAREIEVRPDRTTITYAHIAVTVRETIFAPDAAPAGTGIAVLFQVDSVRPVTLTLRFTPELREMWPKPGGGTPGAEWVARGNSGFYLLHADFPNLAAAIALPGANSGVMAPYQERPQVHPLELILRVDPTKDRGQIYPLLMAVGTTPDSAGNGALEAKLALWNDTLAGLYLKHVAQCRTREASLTEIITPDSDLNADMAWAEASIHQLRARMGDEVGLVAGYYASGDSARPGFGWYFGRDTLYTVYAINGYGDFELARTALEFLLRRQRADGKSMHEYSQTAGEVNWAGLPYEYAAADATPLLLTAILDYVKASGNLSFLRAHRDEIFKAWQFESTHDSDGDGVYDNHEGTGWVESWPGGMPHQEVYLALLDEQASRAMGELARLLGESTIGIEAARRAAVLHTTIERKYYQPETGLYAFSRNAGGTVDRTQTIFPSVAWWNGGAGLDHPESTLRTWASHDFATDWGVRDVAESAALYDPISYHQGSVWPLYTGWAALAQYRSGHPLAAYQATMQNADLTTAQDPGAVTELLSGAYFEPFGRSTSHQLWSSAMVVTPVLRGLFGIDVDALHHTVGVTPNLPADWRKAEVKHLHVGESMVNLDYRREGRSLVVTLAMVGGPPVHLAGGKDEQRFELPAVQLALRHGLPSRGARTSQVKVIGEKQSATTLRLTLDGVAGSESTFSIIRNASLSTLHAEGGELFGDNLRVVFPAGNGYVTKTVTLLW
jgi:hypothetical protein